MEPPDSIADAPDPSEQAEAATERARVHRAVAQLSAHQRAVIELAYWKELSQSEIAAELGIPLGTVKTRTRRALSRLADILDAER
jgi:RNA polymerase sigma-70 factor (ECF subfamily)